jgi:16S rRNA (uracil1498-N3)-methyltransferase
MHRFFVSPELLKETGAIVSLPKELAHQVRDVLCLVVGERLVLLDNSGDEVLAALEESSRAGVAVQLLERQAGKSESPVRIILCQGLLKSARFEWILEKGTESGVAVFAPTLCRRSMAGLGDTGPVRIQRWQRIIQEAAEQSGRSRLPELLPVRPLMYSLNAIPRDALAIMPWEEERNHPLRYVLNSAIGRKDTASPAMNAGSIAPTPVTVVLFIGPEGGFMAEEVKLAQRYGVQVVTLGSRILRAETAALASIANVMYELE